MTITAPYGYDEVAALQKTQRVLLPAGTTPMFCRTLNALAVSVAEFVIAGRDYPVVFAAADGGKSFAPVIVLGLTQGANLFVDASGEWDRSAYFPAFVRRFPFCLSKVYVDDGGVVLFDERGAPTQRWQAVERLLLEFEADLDRTGQMCAAIARLDMLEPFSMRVNDLPHIQLTGMHRVSEARLRALKPASLKALLEKGFLSLLYAHLHSLENFSRLVARQKAAGRG